MRISRRVRVRFIACILAAGISAALLAAPASAAKRVALVVGNSAYEMISPLRNPVNDVTLIANTLRTLGFDVVEETDATQEDLKSAIRDFGKRLRTAGSDAVGLFYFAGHGVQSGEHNYLIPLGAPIEEEADLEFEAVPARWVLGRMEAAGNALNLVILDACRNNPYRSSFRTGSRGLSRMEAPTGSLIAYSAAPGSAAVDGKGENSPYALALKDALEVSGLKVEEVFKKVRNSVLKETGETQTPWEESSLRGDFYFRGGASAGSTPEPDTQPRPSLDARAKALYEAAERAGTVEAYLVVVRQFPGHDYALLAQAQIDKLREAEATGSDPATVEARLSLSADEIRLIQMGLESLGHDPGPADGKLGPKTRVALRAWQEAQGLAPTGRLDNESATELRAAGDSARPTDRIVGGEEAKLGEWPWQVFVKILKGNENSYSFCGGSVVAQRWVLTAAHCVVSRSSGVVSPSKIKVLAGTQNRRKGGRWIDVTAVRSHDGFRRRPTRNDVALLKLARPAGVAPVELPDAARVADIAPPGTGVTVTGWGTLLEEGDIVDHLMEVEVPVVSEQACRAAYPGGAIDHRTLCAGLAEGGKDSCQGDSGGPLVVRDGTQWVQAGVVSWGGGCARPGQYGVYMNVGAFADWLQQNSEFAIAIVGGSVAPQPDDPEISKPEPPAPVVSTPASERAKKLSRLLGRDFSEHAVDRTTGWTDLHYAAVLNLPQVARQLLDAGMDVDVELAEGKVPLGERVNEILGTFGYDIAKANSSRSNTPLHWAARGNALETVRLLVERGADIHVKDDIGGTPLHYAAGWNALQVVRYLVERGVDIHANNDRGWTPLHHAADENALEVVRFLVERGASIHVQTSGASGMRPLHMAAHENAFKVVRYFVERGADIEAKDNHGITPVLWAARGNAFETFLWLVERGADFNARNNKWGNTALHLAARGNALGIAQWLLEHGADVNAKSKDGGTPLHQAAEKNALEVARLLIEYGADVHAKSESGRTPLRAAAAQGALEVVRILVERGADIEVQDEYGMTPLLWTAHDNAFETFLWLVERGADFNARDHKWGNTALHNAALGNALDIARWLLDHGADVNAKAKKGGTPLHQAARRNALEVARFLVERGADIDARGDRFGRTPLHWAAWRDALEVAKFLVGRGADLHSRDDEGSTPLHRAARGNALEVVRWLVDRGVDVNVRDKDGDTPLHQAARGNALEVARWLVDRGVDVNVRDKDGDTPLHDAAVFDSLEVARFLVERGAYISARCKWCSTVLHLAARGKGPEVARFLVEHGADIHAKDEWGRTPLHWAHSAHDKTTALLLVESGANINAKDNEGSTPLHVAVGWDWIGLEAVLLLVQLGADVNATDNKGRTPLDLVAGRSEARSGDGKGDKVRELLLSHGGTCARNC